MLKKIINSFRPIFGRILNTPLSLIRFPRKKCPMYVILIYQTRNNSFQFEKVSSKSKVIFQELTGKSLRFVLRTVFVIMVATYLLVANKYITLYLQAFFQNKKWGKQSLREKCPDMEFFWSVFSRIWTEYGEVWSIQSECGKIWPEKIPYVDTFHAVRFQRKLKLFQINRLRINVTL